MSATESKIQELSATTYQWLSACGIKANRNFLKDEIMAHPDYPALTSVIDVLNAGGMQYRAVQTSMDYAAQFKYPLLAHIKKGTDEQDLVIVYDESEWKTNKNLAAHWTGVLLMPEKDAQWKHVENEAYIKEELSKKRFSLAVLVILIAITAFTITQQKSIATILFTLLSTTGLIIAWLTFTTELGVQNKLVKQVCNSVNPSGGCNKVLKSKQAKGLWGISPADAALGWFATQSIFIIAGTWINELAALKTIAIQCSLAGILAAGWSIISQQFIIKQWCALCLGIAAVLILQFIATVSNIPAIVNIKAFSLFLIFLLLLQFIIILPIKQLLKISTKQKPLQRQLKKWKQDINVFMGLWHQQPLVDCTAWEHELQLGKADAPVQITVACNPYCGPCAVAHEKLDGLIKKYKKLLGVQIRFSINETKEDDVKNNAVRLILQNHVKNNNATNSLTDWFEWKNEEKWKGKYKTDPTIEVRKMLKQHENWAKNAEITVTPTFFINGKKLPGQYTLEDLSNLVEKLIDILQPKKELVD